MGRNAKTQYPRTEVLKIRISGEHIELARQMRACLPQNTSDADLIAWALEEYAERNFKKKILIIPNSRPQRYVAGKGRTGKTIIMGKNN